MFAVIQTGGKQYRVQEGDVIYVEKLNAEIEASVKFDVLMCGEGDSVKIGIRAKRTTARPRVTVSPIPKLKSRRFLSKNDKNKNIQKQQRHYYRLFGRGACV